MKIKVDKVYVTETNSLVAIIAVNSFTADEFKYVGSHLSPDGEHHTAYFYFTEDGRCSYSPYNLVKEYQRPMRKPECITPIYGQEYYVPALYSTRKAINSIWHSDIEDITAFDNGFVFLDEEDAQAATDKLVELFKEYVCHNY